MSSFVEKKALSLATKQSSEFFGAEHVAAQLYLTSRDKNRLQQLWSGSSVGCRMPDRFVWNWCEGLFYY